MESTHARRWSAGTLALAALALAAIAAPAHATSFLTTSGDGWVYDRAGYTGWDSCHHDTIGNNAYPDDPWMLSGIIRHGVAVDYSIRRAFLPFDTTALDGGAEVVGASVSIWVTQLGAAHEVTGEILHPPLNDGYDWLALVGPTTQQSFDTLIPEDYDQCGPVHGAVELSERVEYADLEVGSWATFTLNQAGLDAINAGGITALGLRMGHDLLDYTPIPHANSLVYFNASEAGSNVPFLTVETVPEPGTVALVVAAAATTLLGRSARQSR